MSPPPPWSARAVALASGFVAALGVGGLVSRALFAGYAQSFDAMLYARSLWGLARGELHNPVLDVPSLAIHNHLILGPLSLLTWAFHPASVLLWAQAASLGAAVALVAWRAAAASTRQPPWVAALGAALLATLGAPLVLNPYLYDLHPAVLGLPWMLAGLSRGVARGELDRAALWWMSPALLVREEFGLLIAAALLTAPSPWPWARRLGLAAASSAWYGVYASLVGWLVGSHGASFQQHMLAEPEGGAAWWARLGLAVALLATAGGVWWRGWRWAGAAIPGIAFLLTSEHFVEVQIRLHYGFLVAPGLLAAALAGWTAWQHTLPARRWEPPLWLALGAVSFALWSAAPGGGQYWGEAFDLRGADPRQEGPQRAIHAMLRRVPAEDGLAAPHRFGAPVADRRWIYQSAHIVQAVARDGRPPEALDSIALERRWWGSLGRQLTGQHGFRLLDQTQGVALLTRSPRLGAAAPPPEAAIPVAIPPWPCEDAGGWPAAGLRLCGARRVEGGRVAVALLREPGAPPFGQRLDPLLLAGPGAPPAPLWLMEGLVGAEALPPGRPWVFLVDQPAPGGALALALYAPAAQRALKARAADGAEVEALPLSIP